ncbi:hypothetical protein [Arthrobacter sp. UYCu712]|uniref:hypothetical protein n=1 Tax=Arthrobacter sp. UYCu712 TaxID=3156340 RepID=UPI0033941FE9
MIAHTAHVDMDAAFALLRDHARANNQTIYESAEKIVTRQIAIWPERRLSST